MASACLLCAGCGAGLPPRRRQGNPRKWCSSKCRARFLRHGTGRARVKQCQGCGGDFEPSRSDQQFCVTACHTAWRTRQESARRKAARDESPLICEGCATPFVPDYRNRAKARFCSPRCYRIQNGVSYRARLRNAIVEDFPVLRVFERDNWICQICTEPIDRAAKSPAPWSRSIDHRIPLARGGKHSFDNCQAAHLWCNAAKKHTDLSLAG